MLVLFLLALPPLALFAQFEQSQYPDIGLKNVGVKVGPAIPDSPYKVGFVFGLFADLGKLHEIIGLEANLEYFRLTKTVQQIYTNSHSDISLTATVKIMPDLESIPFDPYVGGGIGFHYLTDTPDETLQEYDPIEHDARLEIHIAIGGTYRITDEIDGIVCFKVNLSDISTYNPYIGVAFDL